jgi:hypothetical protein
MIARRRIEQQAEREAELIANEKAAPSPDQPPGA